MLVTLALMSASFWAMAVDAVAIFSIVAPILISPVWPLPAETAASCESTATSAMVPTSAWVVAEISFAEETTSLVEATCSVSVASSSRDEAVSCVADDVT